MCVWEMGCHGVARLRSVGGRLIVAILKVAVLVTLF